MLPKRFELSNTKAADAGSDSSEDSDTSGKSLENINKVCCVLIHSLTKSWVTFSVQVTGVFV